MPSRARPGSSGGTGQTTEVREVSARSLIGRQVRLSVMLSPDCGWRHTAHLYPVLVTGTGALDTTVATTEVLKAATTAKAENPSIAAFLLECANLPPYAPALRAETGLPVWDITSMLTRLHHGFADSPV
jgi:hypothetical protein